MFCDVGVVNKLRLLYRIYLVMMLHGRIKITVTKTEMFCYEKCLNMLNFLHKKIIAF